MPFGRIQLCAEKPMRPEYPKAVITLGDHIRKKRLDLNLFQKQAAEMIGVSEGTLMTWETHKYVPQIAHLPKIIKFLGYVPFDSGCQTLQDRIKYYRKLLGLTQEQLAKLAGTGKGTIAGWERGNHKPTSELLKKLGKILNTDRY